MVETTTFKVDSLPRELMDNHAFCSACGNRMKATNVVDSKRYDKKSGGVLQVNATLWWHCKRLDAEDLALWGGDNSDGHDAVMVSPQNG